MYIKQVTCENYGPIQRFSMDFPVNADGKPVLIVLVGQNGAGKSLILSALLESLIEIKRHTYANLPEVPKDEYFRLQKQDYVRTGQDYSYLKVEVNDGDSTAQLVEVVRKGPQAEFLAKYPAAQYPHLQKNDAHFIESGFHKNATVPNAIKEAIRRQIAVYFPYFRYESPAWLNPAASPRLETRLDFYGRSTENMVKTNIIQDIESWILDVILDMELYEKQLVSLPNIAPGLAGLEGLEGLRIFAGHSGRNTTTRDLLNQLLTTIYKAKDQAVQRARVGISHKAARRVSIMVKRADAEAEEPIAPTISHLSSGEVMAFAIGATILREHDHLNKAPAQALADIRGIALIDEADLHLHIQFQKEVLPALFRLFPNVQFVVTTHSPLFLLGLSQAADIPHVIYRMPHGQIILAEDFVEFQEAYDTFISREKQFKAAYDAVSNRIKAIERPLVITEGKTDWKHMKAAFTRFRANQEYSDLEFDFHEYEDLEMGDTTLRSMCEQFSRIPNTRRVLFIFDRDNPSIVQTTEDGALGYKNWGNNVFSFCLPIPPHRNQNRISIESYYTDDELRIPDSATGFRLVFSNELRRIVDASVTNKADTVFKIQLLDAPIAAEEQDKVVYDQDCERIVNAAGDRVAHSKAVFASHVLAAQPPFDNFNVERFRLIFDRLREILAA